MASIVSNKEVVPNYEKCWRTVLTERGFSEVGYRSPSGKEYEQYLKVPKEFGKYLKKLDVHGNMYDDFKKFGSGDMNYEEAYGYSKKNYLEAAFLRICGYTVNYTRKKVEIYKEVHKDSDTIPLDADEAVLLESSLKFTPLEGDEKSDENDKRLLLMSTISHKLFKKQVNILSSESLVEFNDFVDRRVSKYLGGSSITQKDAVLGVFKDSIIQAFDDWRREKFET